MKAIARGREGERGSIMLVVALILIALLAGGGIALYVQVSSTKSTSYLVSSRGALYCAEAGLAAGRRVIGQNVEKWPQLLDADDANNPDWYPITGDLDNDGTADYEVTIRDNDDELPPDTNNPLADNDLAVFVVSRCTRYPETPREVFELVMFSTGGGGYRDQAGQGAGNTGNAN